MKISLIQVPTEFWDEFHWSLDLRSKHCPRRPELGADYVELIQLEETQDHVKDLSAESLKYLRKIFGVEKIHGKLKAPVERIGLVIDAYSI